VSDKHQSPKAYDASIRETVIATIRDYRRSLKRLMSIQHRAMRPLKPRKQP
jgi:hypothetical protein